MTLEWSSSTDKRLLLLYNLPDYLKGALRKAWQQHYEELYEPQAEGEASLQDALDEILGLFQDNNQTLSHLRYVWMALVLASVVEPTVKYYQPNSSISEETINRIALWLLETLGEALNPKTQFKRFPIEKDANAIVNVLRIVTENKKIGSFQVLSEALDVYNNAIKALDYNQSLEALLDILDDCLEGYAIFPGSSGRRELFDWWLLDVVPATWYLSPPSSIYSIDKLANEENVVFRQMKRLHEISSKMWSIILKNYQISERLKLRNSYSTFDTPSNEGIKLDVKHGNDKFILNKIGSINESS